MGQIALVAEDNQVNQVLLTTVLKKEGYEVYAAENGQELLDLYHKHGAVVILMDIQMPIMNGIDATKAIRKEEGEAKHTPIIAVTAYAGDIDREKILLAGADEHVAKPVHPKKLVETINATLERLAQFPSK